MFVPSTLKRKKGSAVSKVNAAPSAGTDVDADAGGGTADTNEAARPDLMGALREKLGPMADAARPAPENGAKKRQKVEKPRDDYDRFMEEIGGMLGSSVKT